jgi:hypothetical protein
MENNQSNLAKAVIAVMKELAGVEKNMTVGSGRNAYKGVADKDVKDSIRPLMIKHGLCILPISVKENLNIEYYDSVNYNNQPERKAKVFSSVTTRYKLLHESGESEILEGLGHGADTQDKAAGKATTYAMKYALLYTFMVSVGAIDDTDTTHSDDVPNAPSSGTKPKLTNMLKDRARDAWKNEARRKGVEQAFDSYEVSAADWKYIKGE